MLSFHIFRLLALIFWLLLPAGLVRAGGPDPVVIDFTRLNVPAEIRPALVTTLSSLHNLRFAVVSLQTDGDWALATIAALDTPGADPEAVGMGDGGELVMLHRDTVGDWQAAGEGTPEFSRMAQTAQASPYQTLARTLLAVTQSAPATQDVSATAVPSPTLQFPWDRTQAWYFTQGWHYGNNVDFAPAWAVVNKWVLAAHGGVVTRLCLGALTANLRITHASGVITEYAHLDKTTVPDAILGKNVVQGQLLGKTYPAAFDSTQDACGFSSGPHLHFGLPSQSTTVDGWLSHPDNTWTNATGTMKIAMSTFPSTNMLTQGLTRRTFLPVVRK